MGILTSFMPVSIMFSRSHEVKGGILNGPSIDLDQEPCFNPTNFLFLGDVEHLCVRHLGDFGLKGADGTFWLEMSIVNVAYHGDFERLGDV